ncbi:MAG: hypothetical protein IPL59_00650 [Candidatus Competibacteraceae bacterium]|uniref:Uncharacterized protein n=1 Tax=Candidatus Contendobacter odensis Run_B_J11 TaxID=1400861 RepID=A0A7U7GFC6_9GAMM|nr:hypothetical protein [Candidatus Contendobacter odensis]MBK8533733.1 hypothetical protein [Candidatus Competibacteraceae bacterium]MBK8754095.1 hypothetical protein [Candidatus Competibacteraceae bacterium]CDH46876.1 conserved hypothetical protein [Candidatus Contendobacter odensis Run_B_J11]
MPIHFMKNVACFKEVCTVEEAELLLQWLQDQPRGKVKLKECTHVHTAIVQVLLAARVMVTLPPADPDLARWLMPVLQSRS